MKETQQSWLREARSILVAQAELGLSGVPVPDDFLERASSPTSAPSVQPSRRERAVSAVPPQPASELQPSLSELTDVSPGASGLDATRRVLGECTRCPLHRGRTQIVFGVGNPEARLMFIGEGPGRDEDLQGEPFVGRAGQLLTRMIAAMGLRRDDVYIANIVKCRPPRNRDPEPVEVEACEPFLKAQIAAISPEVIVTLGKYAAQTLLQQQTPISRLRGNWTEYAGITLMPTFHPAYLLRNPAEKRPVWSDLQAVMERLGLSAGGSTTK